MTTNASSPEKVGRRSAAKNLRSRRFHWGWMCFAGLLFSPVGWFGFREIQNETLQPEAIFVLGGETRRERFAAKLAAKHPDLPIWVSGGAPKDYARRVFAKENVDLKRVHLNYEAIDTLSNFTSMVDELRKAGIKSVYLITSDDHMARSRLIGEVVFGGHGIAVKPVSFVSGRPDESWEKVVRDGGRAVFWLFTGDTSSNWVKEYKRIQ